MEELIRWLEIEQDLNNRLVAPSTNESFKNILKDDNQKISLIKEYLSDYEKLANDYHELVKENRLLKLQKMELDSHLIFEDMKMTYRANRRKWRAKT